MIHFKLKDFDEMIPVGQAPDEYLSWFWLTDGELWLTFSDTTIYEYSKDAMNLCSIRYNNYYLVRFLEDFTDCFEKINEPISKKMFDSAKNIRSFIKKANEMYEKNAISNDEYEILSRWVYERSFDSAHLIGGPILYFFRFENTIRIVWETEWVLEDGISLWTAKDGHYDIDFDLFIENVKKFGIAFFEGMGKIVRAALESDLKNVRLDKKRLIEEHQERIADFDKKLTLLEQTPIKTTNWVEIENSMEEFMGVGFMLKEIIENVKSKLANNQIDTETPALNSELDTYIMALSQGKPDFLAELKFYFLPTSIFQEHALSNNWADEYLILSKNFDEIYQKINDTKFIKIKKLILLDFDIHEVSKLAYEVFLDHERDLNENQKTIIENLMLIDAGEGFEISKHEMIEMIKGL